MNECHPQCFGIAQTLCIALFGIKKSAGRSSENVTSHVCILVYITLTIIFRYDSLFLILFQVDPHNTNFNRTSCKCNHLTSFGGFFVKPNPIPPLTADMFLKGYVVFVAVTTVLLFFVIGLVFARRADKKDLLKVLHLPYLPFCRRSCAAYLKNLKTNSRI